MFFTPAHNVMRGDGQAVTAVLEERRISGPHQIERSLVLALSSFGLELSAAVQVVRWMRNNEGQITHGSAVFMGHEPRGELEALVRRVWGFLPSELFGLVHDVSQARAADGDLLDMALSCEAGDLRGTFNFNQGC